MPGDRVDCWAASSRRRSPNVSDCSIAESVIIFSDLTDRAITVNGDRVHAVKLPRLCSWKSLSHSISLFCFDEP